MAHYTRCKPDIQEPENNELVFLLKIWLDVSPVAGQLLYVGLGEALGLDLAEALGEGEERLVVLRLGHVGAPELGVEGGVAEHGEHVQEEAGGVGLVQGGLPEGQGRQAGGPRRQEAWAPLLGAGAPPAPPRAQAPAPRVVVGVGLAALLAPDGGALGGHRASVLGRHVGSGREVGGRRGHAEALEGGRMDAGVKVVGGGQKAGPQHPGVGIRRGVGGRLGPPGGQRRLVGGVRMLPKLDPVVVGRRQGREGGGAGANQAPRLEGLQVAGEEGWLEAPRAPLDHAAVGGQLVVAPRTQEDGLAGAGLRGALGPRGTILELVAGQRPPHHGGARALQEVLGGRAGGRGAGHHRELVWHLGDGSG